MSFYSAPFTFDFIDEMVSIDSGTTDVDCVSLHTAIKLAQESEEGIQYAKIASASGLVELSPGVEVGLTIELLESWQLSFPAGNYIARVAGGNLVGGPGGDPIAYSAGVQTLLIQSSASTVVTASGSVPTAAQNAAAVHATTIPGAGVFSDVVRRQFAVIRGTGVFPSGDGAYEARDTDDAIAESGTMTGTTRTAD